MIKYVEFNRYDEYGEHITPVKNLNSLEKTASSRKYSSAIIDYIEPLQKRDDKYYVVMNAVGSFEFWGMNGNADIFPDESLNHMSLPSDALGSEDYGFKTFEYYAKFYKHHVNKDPKNCFGEVLFSYWNPETHRVELVVAIDRFKSKDTIKKLEAGEDIGVSMGCKVKYDICNICGNKRIKKGDECKHIKNHLREVIDERTAIEWSKELGKKILPGTQVGMINEKPRFFDISEVYVPADSIAHILGKVASNSQAILSTSLAEVIGVTDEDIDKVATMLKHSTITKEINSTGDVNANPDGIMYSPEKIKIVKDNIDKKVLEQINTEVDMPNSILDNMTDTFGALPLLSTLFHTSVPIRPKEFQRIIIVGTGQKDLANALDARDIDFENAGIEAPESADLPIGDPEDGIIPFIKNIIRMRSSHPNMIKCPEREQVTLMKQASVPEMRMINDSDQAVIKSVTPTLIGLAALYMGLKAQVSDRTIKDIVASGMKSRGVQALLGGAVLANIINSNKDGEYNDIVMTPAKNYENTLKPTLFSGHMVKSAGNKFNLKISPEAKKGLKGAAIIGGITFPLAHLMHSYNRSNIINKGRPAGTIAHSVSPIKTPAALATLGGTVISLLSKIKRK